MAAAEQVRAWTYHCIFYLEFGVCSFVFIIILLLFVDSAVSIKSSTQLEIVSSTWCRYRQLSSLMNASERRDILF